MSIRSTLLSALAAPALLALGACAAPFQANVSRFQNELPAPQGQSFAIVARDASMDGSLEFNHYADLLAAELTRIGYRTSTEGEAPDLTVRFAYGVDNGRERIRREPGFGDPFWGAGWYGPGRLGQPLIVRTRHGYRYVRGFYDPFLFGPSFGDFDTVRSYTVYTSGLDLLIERTATGERLFEGSAEAVSRTNDLAQLVPNLIEAMFTGFPGNSGETVRITVAPERTASPRN